MLQDIRANTQGAVAKIIIGLIVISFAIFGIESLLFSGGPTGVAEVNGEEISPFALQQEVSVQQRQLLSLLGDDADPALLDEAALSRQALDSLIQQEILRQAAGDMDLTASDQVIADIIASMEQFQINGRFSRDMFQSTLATAGFTPALFRARLAQDIQIGQLRAGLAGSDFGTPRELESSARVAMEGRDVRYATIPVDGFADGIDITEEALAAYYEANQDDFMSPETLDLAYLELRIEDYFEPVSEERLRREFELVKDEYELPQETRVSHILLEGNEEERAQRARAVLAALAGGMDFSAAAEQFSDDIGSAADGGDLGFTAGDTFPAPMEEAIATLAVGERSSPVETDAGTHIILVTDRREGTEIAFADVRAELEDRLQRADARADMLIDVERLRDVSFNAADLTEPAKELDLTVQRATGITRSGAEGLFSDPRLRDAAFSDDVLGAGHNSEVIELAAEHYVVLRVSERRAPRARPLEEVRGTIAARLRDAAAREAAADAAAALLARLDEDVSLEVAAREAGFEWQVELGARRDSTRLPRRVRDRLFSLPAPDGGPRREVVQGSDDATYVLEFIRLSEGSFADLAAADQARLRQQIAGERGGLLQRQFEASLQAQADVVVY